MLGRILRRVPLQSGSLREGVHDTFQNHPAASKGGLWFIGIASAILLLGWLIPEPVPPAERELKLWMTERAERIPWVNPIPPPEPVLSVTVEEFKTLIGDQPYAVLYDAQWHKRAWEMPFVFVSGWDVDYLGQLDSKIWIWASDDIPGLPCFRFECDTVFDQERGVFTFTAGEGVSWDSFLRRTKTTLFVLGFTFLSYAWRFRTKLYVTWREMSEWAMDPRTWVS